MDNNKTQDIHLHSGDASVRSAVDKTFNGWFLMNTSQVSTRGVTLPSKTSRNKKHSGCRKVAVGFFSLQAGYPVCGFCFNELIPSKYMFMKNALICVRNDRPYTLLICNEKDTHSMSTALFT